MKSENKYLKRVEEIMIPIGQYPHITEDATLKDAILVIENSQINHRGRLSLPRVLLIFDKDEKLCGTVRRRDIMRGLEPKFLLGEPLDYRKKLFDVQIDPNLTEMSFEKNIKGMKEQTNRKVGEVMLPIRATIDYDDHLIKAAYMMVSLNLSLLPVLKGEKVIGILRSVDVFQEIVSLVS